MHWHNNCCIIATVDYVYITIYGLLKKGKLDMKFKKVLAGVLAAAMIVGSSVSSFAGPSAGPEPEPAPVTPVNPDDECVPCVPDYCYPVYPCNPGRVIVTPGRRSASSSASTGSQTSNTKKALYRVESKIAETPAYKILKETKPEITDIIDSVNDGTMEMEELSVLIPEDPAPKKDVRTKLAGKDFVTPFFDLAWVDGVTQADKDTIKNAEGKYVVDLKIPALTEKLTGIAVLHYSVDRGEWEVEELTAKDLAKKQISVGFKDFSPVAVIADASSIED